MDWIAGWGSRKSHTLTGSTAGPQTNYPVSITVHYGSGSDTDDNVYCDENCRTDFGDIRFTKADGKSLLQYWLDPASIVESDKAEFWVKVDSIPDSPGTVDIYIYYGKEVATTSDGEATFLMFDDFPGTSLHGDWTQNLGPTASITVSGGILTLDSGGANSICAITREGGGVMGSYRVIYRFAVKASYAVVNNIGTPGWYRNSYYNRWAWWYSGRQHLYGTADFNWHTMEARPSGNHWMVYLDNVYKATNPDTTTATKVGLNSSGQSDASHGGKTQYTTIIVKTYCSPEPTHTAWGIEEHPISGEFPAFLIIAPLLVAAFILILSTTKNKARARASHIKSLYYQF